MLLSGAAISWSSIAFDCSRLARCSNFWNCLWNSAFERGTKFCFCSLVNPCFSPISLLRLKWYCHMKELVVTFSEIYWWVWRGDQVSSFIACSCIKLTLEAPPGQCGKGKFLFENLNSWNCGKCKRPQVVNCYRGLLLYSHAQIHCWCRSQALLTSVWIGVYICRASFVGVLYGTAALSTTNVAVPMIAHSIANLIAAVQWKLENKKEIETWQSSRAHWKASHCKFSCPFNTSMYFITMSKLLAG